MTVRALVFDVFGTLVDWRSGVAREAAHEFRRRAFRERREEAAVERARGARARERPAAAEALEREGLPGVDHGLVVEAAARERAAEQERDADQRERLRRVPHEAVAR